jgi:hypothetical protein
MLAVEVLVQTVVVVDAVFQQQGCRSRLAGGVAALEKGIMRIG